MSNPWFKFYGSEYLSDPKVSNLTATERSCWLTILCLVSSSNESGKIRFLTEDILLEKSGVKWDPYKPEEWDAAKGVLQKLSRLKMIALEEDGTITVLNWEKKQDSYLSNAERQARYRERNAARNESNARIDKNRIDNNSESEDSQGDDIQSVAEEDTVPTRQLSKRGRTIAPTKDALEVFALFKGDKSGWGVNKTYRLSAQRLFDSHGVEKIRKALDFYEENKDEQYCPSIFNPFDLEMKWDRLRAFRDKV